MNKFIPPNLVPLLTNPRLVSCAMACLLMPSIANAECAKTFEETCNDLEAQVDAQALQQAVNECREVVDGPCKQLLDEEDVLVMERFYHSYADSLQRLAARMENADYRKRLHSLALQRWEQYFEWLGSLSVEQREEMLSSPDTRKGRKIRAAAAAIGISALMANQPEAACIDYEHLDNGWFGSDALNWWLAALVYPQQPDIVNDTIFRKIAANAALIRAHSTDPQWKEHWDAFAQKARSILLSGRFGTSRSTNLEKIESVLKSSAHRPQARRNR